LERKGAVSKGPGEKAEPVADIEPAIVSDLCAGDALASKLATFAGLV
jgi:hypothetical protein